MLDALAALSKALTYAALMSAAGAVIASATLSQSATLTYYADRIASRYSVALLVLCAFGAAILIARLGVFDTATLGAISSSSTGAAIFMQLAGAGLLLTLGADESANG